MKLFFASDLHGCLPSTQAALSAFEQSGADFLILLGDLLNHGPRNAVPQGYAPAAVAELLNTYADKVIAVRGNCESEVDQMLINFLIMADYNIVLLPDGRRLFLTHGHLYNSKKRPALSEGDIIAHGHTHIPVAELSEGQYIFNPGSTTIPRDGYQASYGLLEDNTLKVIQFGGEVICQVELK